MKYLIYLLTTLLLLLGCSTKQIIPPEPNYKPIHALEFSNGICFDTENAKNLMENIKALKAYQEELVRLLKEK